jgi:hypothetical protein
MPGIRKKLRLPLHDSLSRRLNQPVLEELETRTLLSTSVVPSSLLSLTSQPTVTFAAVSSPNSITNPSRAPFTPGQLRGAYGFNRIQFSSNGGYVAGNGAGQTIAITDAFNDPDLPSDLVAFDTKFGLPNPPSFTVLNQNGGTDLSGIPNSPASSDWALEESLDVEWAHTIAPAANIVLFEANSNNNVDVDTADLTAANPATYAALGLPAAGVISNSFGTNEGTNPATQETQADEQYEDANFFQPISNEGTVTVVVSAGDNGVMSYPAVSPYVLSVGGTSLRVTAGPFGVNYSSETAWSTSPNGNSPTGYEGTGGGTSLFEPEPTYQSNYGISNTGGFRATPDVSQDANPSTGVYVLDSYDGGLFQVGGTSLSAPLWSGMLAITNQGRALQNEGPLANAQEAVYQVPSSDYHDITSGHNLEATAGPGYDEVTGLGTPIANLIVYDLVNSTTGSVVVPGAIGVTNPSLPSNLSATSPNLHNDTLPTGSLPASSNASVAIASVASLDPRLAAPTSITVTLPSTSSVVHTDTSALTSLPAHATPTLEAMHGDSGQAIAPTSDAAATVDPSLPTEAIDLPMSTAAPVRDFTTASAPATPIVAAADAAFADLGDPSVAGSIADVPALIVGDEGHSNDMALLLGTALVVGGAWNTAARVEENWRHPALRR